MFASVPDILVGDDARPYKRRRLSSPTPACRTGVEAYWQSEVATQPAKTPTHATADPDISEDTIICFGMIIDQPAAVPLVHPVSSSYNQEAVTFDPPRNLRHTIRHDVVGHIDSRVGQILHVLAADGELAMQLALSSSAIAAEPKAKPSRGATQYLSIILYGPRHRLADVGDFVTDCGLFLEDPIGANRNVPYLNPQCLFSLHEPPPMTFDIHPLHGQIGDGFASTCANVLSKFETKASFEESATPNALCTSLKPHQRQALTFFLRRERGLHPSEDSLGIWSQQHSAETLMFINAITGEVRPVPGPLWRGGLLADEMGLGKTLSIIALIASDKDTPAAEQEVPGNGLLSTLVIVPMSLLVVWQTQLKDHVHEGRLTWCVHHGKTRFRRIGLKPPDIVFTTYQTVEREQRKDHRSDDSLYSYQWKRIVLDEAHIIRNHNTATARAVSALHAASRWAISGTPIQNNLTDFLGLFKFLHFAPYDDAKVFDDDISALWRTRSVGEATETFKTLLACLMLRRTKTILNLPPREDKIVKLPFGNAERAHYERVERPIVDMLDHDDKEGAGPSIPWMTAIQQINKLRLICNLGLSASSRQPSTTQIGDLHERSTALAARLSVEGETCVQCLQPIESAYTGHSLESSVTCKVYHSACSRFYCADCAELLRYIAPQPCDCTGPPRSCGLQELVFFLPTPRLTPTGSSPNSPMALNDKPYLSSKVWALVTQIRSHPNEKHIVFSSWTSSLDMVERGLAIDPDQVIQSVRIDGKVKASDRSIAVQRLRDDPSIRVILITIACGACGLDLTAASRVHLLEPQWNPSLEDQALARAHRLGQTRPVTTMRYVMEGSFEEHILKVQDRKKLLATTLLSNGSALENLRELLHESRTSELE